MDGIVIIYKEKGCTSHDVVYKVKKIFNEKVGHTGTLDPLAEGVLPILIGKGTLASKYLINHDKKYIAILQLGTKTDTADEEGKVIEKSPVDEKIFCPEEINKVLHSFVGEQEQIPPMYSALKVNGKKLYEYARKGQKVEIQPRKIEIYNIKLIDYSAEKKQITFEIYCGKGTYIRTLCEGIAKKFGTCGYMKSLKRIQVGNFTLDNCIKIDELEKNKENSDFLDSQVISIEKLFEKSENILLNDEELKRFLNGVKLDLNTQNKPEKNIKDGIYKVYHNGKFDGKVNDEFNDKINSKVNGKLNSEINGEFIGIGIVSNEKLKRDIILK